MIECKKPVHRIMQSTVFEKGKMREVIVSLLPGGTIGFRLKGTRSSFFLQASREYVRAVNLEAQNNMRKRKTVKRSII